MESRPIAAKFLERALLFTIVCHAVAMLSMALFLLPGMPGHGDVAQRMAYIQSHPWQWRIGWFPWQVTALSDLILAFALIQTKWIPRVPAFASLVLTMAAFLVEQPAEYRWIFGGVEIATNGSLEEFAVFEAAMFRQTSLWAAMFYTLAAVAWSFCFIKARTWNKLLTILSIVTWGVLLVCSLGPLLTPKITPAIIAGPVGLGFTLMLVWFIVATELVLRRSRPFEATGRMAYWQSPYRPILSRIVDGVANSRLMRAFGEFIPSVPLVSDVTNVLFVNYLVAASDLERFVPEHLELQRLGPNHDQAIFTVLIYNHGNLGPKFLKSLRRLLPSPVQSNWRIHVRDPKTEMLGVAFVSTTISNPISAFMARFASEGLPMQIPAKSGVVAQDEDSYQVWLETGTSSAPDLSLFFQKDESARQLDEAWAQCFDDYRAAIEYIIPQDRVFSSQPWYKQLTRQEIRLGIQYEDCQPVHGTVVSNTLSSIIGEAEPICFRVARVEFRYDFSIVEKF